MSTALRNLTAKVYAAFQKYMYALGVFVDIQGAFENLIIESLCQAAREHVVHQVLGDWINRMLSIRISLSRTRWRRCFVAVAMEHVVRLLLTRIQYIHIPIMLPYQRLASHWDGTSLPEGLEVSLLSRAGAIKHEVLVNPYKMKQNWWTKTNCQWIQSSLARLLRIICMSISCAFRSTTGAALNVILSQPPMHIFIHERQWRLLKD